MRPLLMRLVERCPSANESGAALRRARVTQPLGPLVGSASERSQSGRPARAGGARDARAFDLNLERRRRRSGAVTVEERERGR